MYKSYQETKNDDFDLIVRSVCIIFRVYAIYVENTEFTLKFLFQHGNNVKLIQFKG